MKNLFTMFITALFPFLLFSQDIKVEKAIIDIPSPSYRWGNDVVVLDAEPVGNFYGVQRTNGTIYAVINDTLTTPNLGLIIKTSTDRGDTWQLYPSGIAVRDKFESIKLVRSGLDSVYCFFVYGTNIYCWNIESLVVNSVHAGNYRGYDAVASSTGNLYIIADSLPNNSIVRYGSPDGGYTWLGRGLISSNAAFPQVTMSTSGDTLVLNYYGPVIADTLTGVIRNVRYRETGPGTMSTTGSFTDLIPAGETKTHFRASFRNGEIFFAYARGVAGTRDIYFRKSLDNGVTFSTEEPMVNMPGRDEYWFDIKSYAAATGGFDIVYYSDSTTGIPTVGSDQLLFTGNSFGSLTVPLPGSLVNQYPLEYSDKGFIPNLTELYYSSDDVGVLYVASTGSGKKLVWDYLTNIIPVELTSFTAAVVDGQVFLSWSTGTETNNKGFEIQRASESSADWQSIGFIEGNGTTTSPVSYSFADPNTLPGIWLYRLKQIDLDGTYEFSAVVNTEVGRPDKFELSQNYPNPFNPVTTIKYQIPESSSGLTRLKIYDVTGKEVAVLVNEVRAAGTYEVEFSGSSLASGMYFYELTNGNFTSVRKMILLK